jgi:RAD50-interacting protein 1
MKALQPATEGGAPHLIDFVEQTSKSLRTELRVTLSQDLEGVLKKIKWPVVVDKLLGETAEDWKQSVEKLLLLQEPELEERQDEVLSPCRQSDTEETVLLPLAVMVKALELRFRYHFEGDKPTNRPEKPEYFLSHITELIGAHSPFFSNYLQPILREKFSGTSLAKNVHFVDSTSAFITALLPMLRRKVFHLLPQINSQPQLLSHFLHELIAFDRSLTEDWGYTGASIEESWKGLTWEVLEKNGGFARWLKVEKDFALSRYESIIANQDGWEIDYDSVDPMTTKPTKSAMRVKDLLETITERYRPLASFSQKLGFLIDIQIAILDTFHNRLHSSLEAYVGMTSSVARAVQGISADDIASIAGVGALERLCRVFGSAEYLERAMVDWSEDVFFLELWSELQARVKANARNGANVAGPKSVEEVTNRTSSKVGSETEVGALFDETATSYKTLRQKTEGLMVESAVSNLHQTLYTYSRV